MFNEFLLLPPEDLIASDKTFTTPAPVVTTVALASVHASDARPCTPESSLTESSDSDEPTKTKVRLGDKITFYGFGEGYHPEDFPPDFCVIRTEPVAKKGFPTVTTPVDMLSVLDFGFSSCSSDIELYKYLNDFSNNIDYYISLCALTDVKLEKITLDAIDLLERGTSFYLFAYQILNLFSAHARFSAFLRKQETLLIKAVAHFHQAVKFRVLPRATDAFFKRFNSLTFASLELIYKMMICIPGTRGAPLDLTALKIDLLDDLCELVQDHQIKSNVNALRQALALIYHHCTLDTTSVEPNSIALSLLKKCGLLDQFFNITQTSIDIESVNYLMWIFMSYVDLPEIHHQFITKNIVKRIIDIFVFGHQILKAYPENTVLQIEMTLLLQRIVFILQHLLNDAVIDPSLKQTQILLIEAEKSNLRGYLLLLETDPSVNPLFSAHLDAIICTFPNPLRPLTPFSMMLSYSSPATVGSSASPSPRKLVSPTLAAAFSVKSSVAITPKAAGGAGAAPSH